MAGYNRPLDLPTQLLALNGSPNLVGTIVATTTKNNSDTATPFTIKPGAAVMLQSDTAVYVRAGEAATLTVTTANGFLLAANEKFTLLLHPDETYLACLAVAGTSNVKVFQLR